MLPTPQPHSSHDPNHTYPPSEDTYHLLDVLSSPSQTAYLRQRFLRSSLAPLILEIGVGSGVVLAFLTAHAGTIFGREDVLTLGTDVNALACVTARGTIADAHQRSAGMHLDILGANLASPLREGSVDVLVFNPPYVPSETLPFVPASQTTSAQSSHDKFLHHNTLLALATDGGEDGMEVTRLLLAQLPRVLSQRGVAFVLSCARNKPKEVVASVKAWEGGASWEANVVGESGGMAGWERLCIMRIARKV